MKELIQALINQGIITATDIQRMTTLELLLSIVERVNELHGLTKEGLEAVQRLLDKGVQEEVVAQLNEWLQDGTFDTLINQTALKNVNDRIDETIAQLSHVDLRIGKKYVFDTIELMAQSTDLKVGDVVELLGYYAVGDGGGHQRIISSSDDGSGINVNGKFANVVANAPYVNVAWYGAKGDGVQVENSYLNKAHMHANGKKVVYKKGVYLVEAGKELINITGSVDFMGSTIKLKARLKPFDNVFIFNGENAWNEYGTINEELKKGMCHLSVLDAISDLCLVRLEGKQKYINGNQFEFKEYFYHSGNGDLVGRAFTNWDSNNYQVYWRHITKPYTIENGLLMDYCDGGVNTLESFHFNWFEIKNVDNLTIKNMILRSGNFIASRTFFKTDESFNLKYEDVTFNGNYATGTTQGIDTAWGYAFHTDNAVKVTIDRFITQASKSKSWSSYGMNSVKDIKVNNSQVYTIDQHSLCQDIVVNDSLMNFSQLSGDGVRIFNNVTFHPNNTDSLFGTRGGSGTNTYNYFDGEIVMNDCTVILPNKKISSKNLVIFNGRIEKSSEVFSPSILRRAVICNLKFENASGKTIGLFGSGYENEELPYELIFRDVDFSLLHLDNFGVNSSTIIGNTQVGTRSRDSEGYAVNCNFNLIFENCRFGNKGRLNSWEKNGVIINQIAEWGNLNNLIPRMVFDKCSDILVTPSCHGILEIYNSTIRSLILTTGNDSNLKQKIYINNSRIANCYSGYDSIAGAGDTTIGNINNVVIDKYSFESRATADDLERSFVTHLNKINENSKNRYTII